MRIIRKAVNAFQRPASSSSLDESGPTLTDMLSDDKTPSPEEQVLNLDDLNIISKLLDAIDERKQLYCVCGMGLTTRSL